MGDSFRRNVLGSFPKNCGKKEEFIVTHTPTISIRDEIKDGGIQLSCDKFYLLETHNDNSSYDKDYQSLIVYANGDYYETSSKVAINDYGELVTLYDELIRNGEDDFPIEIFIKPEKSKNDSDMIRICPVL